MNPRAVPAIVKLLEQGHVLNKYKAGALAFCHQRTAQRALRAAHSLRLCHIIGWEMIYCALIPVYKGGPGKDFPRPRTPTHAEKARARRKDPAVRAEEAQRIRLMRLKHKGLPAIPSLANMLRSVL